MLLNLKMHLFPRILISFIVCFSSIEKAISSPITTGRPTSDLIFVTDTHEDKIYASNLSASGPTSLSAVNVIEEIDGLFGIDYDTEQDYIYWTDVTLKSIQRARYDGTDHMTVIADTRSVGLAIDLSSRRMFWTASDRIEVAYLNGTGRSSVVTDSLVNSSDIVADSLHGLLFWTDTGTDKIERAHMDGSCRLTVIGTDLSHPTGIAIDPVDNVLYWCDWTLGKLETSDLFGYFRKILLQDSSVNAPFDVAVHAEYLYWTDTGSGYLKRINRYESDDSTEQVGSSFGTGILGLHVYEVDECSSSPCQNSSMTCMDLINSFICSCPEGFGGPRCEVDIEIPSVICPDDIDMSTDSIPATVNWLYPVVTDNFDTDLTATCTPSPSSSFNVGVTDVTCSAIDTGTNKGSCTFKVNVIVDNERPIVICPVGIDMDTDSSQATVAWPDPVVIDNVDTGLLAACNPSSGSTFNVGSTVGICSAIDAAGNEANCTFRVDVEGIASESSTGYLVAVVILLVIILVMSPALIYFFRFYYFQKNRIEHSTGMKMTDSKVPKSTTGAVDNRYETPLQTTAMKMEVYEVPKSPTDAADSNYETPLQTTAMKTTDYEVPKSTTDAADNSYETPLQTAEMQRTYDYAEVQRSTTDAADNFYENPLQNIGDDDAAAPPPKYQSQTKGDLASDDPHKSKSVEAVYTNVRVKGK